MTLPGIDVSHIGQGSAFNWEAWRGKIAFAGIKATQGTSFRDPDLERNISGASSIGAKVMGYHFLDPLISGKSQADYFLAYFNPQPGQLVMLDNEDFGPTAAPYHPAMVADCAAQFADEVRAAVGAWPVVYADQSMTQEGYCDGLGACPAFIAAPGTTSIPIPIGPWRMLSFRQTGQRGVDTDVFFGTAAELERLAVLHAKPKPQPNPVVVPLHIGALSLDEVYKLISDDNGKTWHN